MVEEEFTKVARGRSNFIGIGKKCRESLTTRIFFGIINLSFLSLISFLSFPNEAWQGNEAGVND